ncbi:hypothetical protein [Oceanicoccus sp. KOV_DT_Chl]|uniref:hypothetical protein n=1 Tax=Oceanicoccus sp. KOV_DT_Chl TaxID=1904639 RepID=UPI000C7A9835|nr:hypothetical protein [Oceanicoccus sp. KOV_DT_Chl]
MKPLLSLLLLIYAPYLLADTARIATWNLGGFHQIPQSNLNMIALGLKLLDADIIVLPELNPLSSGEWLATTLSHDLDPCHKAIVPDQPRARQEIGFLMKCDVEVLGSGMIIGSDLGKQGYRNAAFVHARIENYDFMLIGVHLKAGRGTTNRKLRAEQLEKIEAFAQGIIAMGEKDILIVGDYNMIPDEDEEDFAVLEAQGLPFMFPSSGLEGGSHISTSGGTHIGNLLDGFGFTILDSIEFNATMLKIIPMHEKMGLSLSNYRNNVTDHLPLVGLFETGVDHD